MSATEPSPTTSVINARARVESLRDQVRLAAITHGGHDLAQALDGIPEVRPGGPVRVIVAGAMKRGKSTLINSLVGRPLLTPVGVDVTTACWVEIGYGDDGAVALLANADMPGEPTRRAIAITEVERYVALHCVAEPVLGVEVRVRSALLKDLVLVDTPGVGGLEAGHSRATLTALGQADALLFVSDSTQPILAPEVEFLASAVQRVATVIIAVTRSDTPGYAVVLRETCDRLARHSALAAIPVFAVSAPLADQAADIDDQSLADEFARLSGVSVLADALRQRASVGREEMRVANCAQTTASVARTLSRRLASKVTDLIGEGSRAAELDKEEARLAAVLQDRSLLSLLVRQHLAQLRVQPRSAFDGAAADLGRRYREEAERGPAAQLATLAARMTADLTAAGVTTLEQAAEQSRQVLRNILDRVGADRIAADLPIFGSSTLELSLREPESSKPASSPGLAKAADLFPTLVKLIAGSALAVSVLTGPGAVAASLALAACAGWWQVRGSSEQERRGQLRDWVDTAATQASSAFGREMDRRADGVQQYLDGVLPDLLDAQRQDLAQVRAELTKLREGGAEMRQLAITQLTIAADLLGEQADAAAENARALISLGVG